MPASPAQVAEMRDAIRHAAELHGWEAPAAAAGESSPSAQAMAFLSKKGWAWWGGVGWDDAVPPAERRAAEAAAATPPTAALPADAERSAAVGVAAGPPPAAAAAAASSGGVDEVAAAAVGGEEEEEELTPRSRAVARDPAVAAIGQRCALPAPPVAAPAPAAGPQPRSTLNPEAKEWRPASSPAPGPAPDGRARGESLLSTHLRLRRKSQAPPAPALEADDEAPAPVEEQPVQGPATPATVPQEIMGEPAEVPASPVQEEGEGAEGTELAPQDLRVAGHDVEPRGRRTLFAITFTLGGDEHVVPRYYSDFRALRAKVVVGAPPPAFPGKTFFRCSGRALDARQARLDAWLRAAVAGSWREGKAGDALRRFLSVGDSPMSPAAQSSIASPRASPSCRG